MNMVGEGYLQFPAVGPVELLMPDYWCEYDREWVHDFGSCLLL
jgi:hypothetical protein